MLRGLGKASGGILRQGRVTAALAPRSQRSRLMMSEARTPIPDEDCGCGDAMSLDETKAKIKGDIEAAALEIRTMKEAGQKDKAVLQPKIDELLSLKTQWEAVTGTPFDPPKKDAKPKKAAPAPAKKKGGAQGQKESLVITARDVDYSQWYTDVIMAAEMVDQSPVKGCMVIRPWGMAVWDEFKDVLNGRIKESGAQNAYFPLFIPMSFLSKEAEHVEGFAKECAVVTHHRLTKDPNGPGLMPDPAAKLEEPLIVRPTSETIIWDMFRNWISSHRDLPLKINQWANVVRWELRTRPFLRSAEFMWQEGHTAHATREEAIGCAREMLDVYVETCRDYLALPVVKGIKSPTERFAGADETFTIEALMQNGWALQSGTSHFLGQNFAKAFDVTFQNKEQKNDLVWATSWGVSTRLMGALVMTHSDDSGLVLPPKVAPSQVVIVPVGRGKKDKDAVVDTFVDKMVAGLKAAGVRYKIDDREKIQPGQKFYEWERKGVPLRIEVGPRDAEAGSFVIASRLGGDKETLAFGDGFASDISERLDAIQAELLKRAEDRLAEKTIEISSYDELKSGIEGGGFFLAPWKDDADNEETIKTETKATIRCFPLEKNQDGAVEGKKCFYSGKDATHMAIFARAF